MKIIKSVGGLQHDQQTRQRVAELWNDGKFASQVAREIGEGLTRNAVIGLVFRMRRSGMPIRGRAVKWEADTMAMRPLAETKRERGCSWDGCRCARERGSYCKGHAERVYQPRPADD